MSACIIICVSNCQSDFFDYPTNVRLTSAKRMRLTMTRQSRPPVSTREMKTYMS